MAEADNALQEYWNDEVKFADLFNAKLFGGKNVIKPDELEELDTKKTVKTRKGEKSFQLNRDLIKVAKLYRKEGVQLVILGLEHQENIHYAMPMRVMGYDYSEYKKQYQKNAKKYCRNTAGMTADEFLSKMKRTDRFYPVITLVMYYGEKSWDGAKTLHEMLYLSEELKDYVNNYKMHLIELKDNSLPLQNKNNQDFFKLCSILLDSEKTDEQKEQEAEAYESEHPIEEEVIQAIAGATNYEFEKAKESERTMTCTFFQHLEERGLERGIEQGLERGIEQGLERGTELTIIRMVLKTKANNLSAEETSKMLEIELNTVQKIYDIKNAYPDYNEQEIYQNIHEPANT